jgi:hypothetical protein
VDETDETNGQKNGDKVKKVLSFAEEERYEVIIVKISGGSVKDNGG